VVSKKASAKVAFREFFLVKNGVRGFFPRVSYEESFIVQIITTAKFPTCINLK